MKTIITTTLAALFLISCATYSRQNPMDSSLYCKYAGLKFGTEAFANCKLRYEEYQSTLAYRRAKLRQDAWNDFFRSYNNRSNCTSMVFGRMITTNCY